MEKKTLYRYARADGGVTVSPDKPPEGTVYEMRMRLIAGEGMMLTDGETMASCVDAADASGWDEVPAPQEDVDSAGGIDI